MSKKRGRPFNYEEPTQAVSFKTPISKIEEFKDHARKKLETWAIKK